MIFFNRKAIMIGNGKQSKIISLSLLSLFFYSLMGEAKVIEQNFNSLKYEEVKNSQNIFWTSTTQPYFSWANSSPTASLLNGEVYPLLEGEELAKKLTPAMPVMVFETRTTFIVKRSSSEFTKDKLVSVEALSAIDQVNDYRSITDEQALNIIEKEHFMTPILQSPGDRFLLHSSVPLPELSLIKNIIEAYILRKKSEGQKVDEGSYTSGLSSLSEIIYFDLSDSKDPYVKELTAQIQDSLASVNPQGPISGALLQDIFYANHIIKYGKNFIYFQPLEKSKTLVTMYTVLAINKQPVDGMLGVNLVNGVMGADKIGCELCLGLQRLSRKTAENLKDYLSQAWK